MTSVEFLFLTPDGVPIANSEFEVQLSAPSHDDTVNGILMPRLVTGTTDATGKCVLQLEPAKAAYYVTMYDSQSDAQLGYKFVVPVMDIPGTVVRLQDLIIDGPISTTYYDEAAIAAIQNTKANALAAQQEADRAAAAADTSAQASAASAAASLTSEAHAFISESNAATSASNAHISEVNAAGSAQSAADSATAAATTVTDAINTALTQAKQDIIANAPLALDTLNELASALGDDPNFATTMSNALANRVRVDAPQSLSTGQQGQARSNIGLDQVNNTSDANKPISTAAQTALNLKAPINNPVFTGTVGGVTAAMVGLGNVNNTSDAAKPVSTAQQAALDLKAPLANPAFTGNVTGVTKAMVGLGNVDNTSDANKPVSTAQANALALKQPLHKALETNAYSQRLTIIGSSVPNGYGATNRNGWAQKLATQLVNQGYTTTNICIDGDTTAGALARFYSQLVPTRPDVVILAYSLGNDGIHEAAAGAAKEAVYNTYIGNLFKLANMCRQLGIKVIFAGCYGRNDFTALDYQYVKQANQELENTGMPVLGISTAVDDYTGHWRTGMWFDGFHPNDVGHEAMYRACQLSLFDRVPDGSEWMMPTPNGVYAAVIGLDVSAVPLLYTPENNFGSVTAMCNVRRPPGAASGRAFLSFLTTNMATGCIRIRNPVDAWELTYDGNQGTAGQITSTRLSSDATRVNIAIRSDYFTNNHTFFVDGVKIGVLNLDVGQITAVGFGNRVDNLAAAAVGYELDSFTVWRTGLTDEQIMEAANGRISKTGLALYSPSVDEYMQQNSHLINLAPSSTYLAVGTSDITTVQRSPYIQKALNIVVPDAGARTPLATFGHVGQKSLSIIGEYGATDIGGTNGILLDPAGGALGIGASGVPAKWVLDANGNVNVGGLQTGSTYRHWVNGNSSFGNSGGGYDVVDVVSPYAGNNTVTLRSEVKGNSGAAGFGTTSNHPLYFLVNNGQVARFDASGNFMVGTTAQNANAKFSFTGGDMILSRAGANAGLGIESTGGSGKKYYLISDTTGSLQIYDSAASAQRITLDTNGNFMVGATASSVGERILLASPNGTRAVMRLMQVGQRDWYVGMPNGGSPNFAITDASAGVERLTIDTSGNLLIGAAAAISTIQDVAVFNRAQNDISRIVVNNQNNGAAAQSMLDLEAYGAAWRIAVPSVAVGNTNPLIFTTTGASSGEKMRLDYLGNVLVNTTVPQGKLTVAGTIASVSPDLTAVSQYLMDNTGLATVSSYKATGGALRFSTADTSGNVIERARFDSLGNFGLGVIPSAWNTVIKGFDIGIYGGLASSSSAVELYGNGYWAGGGTGYVYKTAGAMSNYQQTGGTHRWMIAPSAAAGATVASMTTAMMVDNGGNLLVGVTSGSVHTISKNPAVPNSMILNIDNSTVFFTGSGNGYNAAASVQKVLANTTSGRSINAAGTINASGADYAEYMTKAEGTGELVKGQIVGVDAQGKLTDKWANAVSFLIKSTDPSYVGGDIWGSEEALGITRPTDEASETYEADLVAFNTALEAARAKVDRIAYAGQVPVNVTGAMVGQYIVPVQAGDGIAGSLVNEDDMTLKQYMKAVGIVQNILPDGRANVRVKVA